MINGHDNWDDVSDYELNCAIGRLRFGEKWVLSTKAGFLGAAAFEGGKYRISYDYRDWNRFGEILEEYKMEVFCMENEKDVWKATEYMDTNNDYLDYECVGVRRAVAILFLMINGAGV